MECSAAFFAAHDTRPASVLTPAQVQRLRPAVHQDLTQLHDDLVFVKTHNANLALHGVPFCTPEVSAGAIVVIRDPRDVVMSYAAYAGMDVDVAIDFMRQRGAANRGTDAQVFELLSSWSAHVESWSRSNRHLLIRYEDMVAAPESVFGKVIHFLGDDPDPARLSRAIAFSRFEELSSQEAKLGYAAHAPGAANRFFRDGRVGQWRDGLTAAQVARLEAAHGDVMRRFGYL